MELLNAKWIKLWLLWILAIGFGNSRIGDFLLAYLTSTIYISYYSPLYLVFFAIYFLANGGISGLAQWLVLKIHIDISGWSWIFTTILESILSLYLLDMDIASTSVALIFYSAV